MSHSFCKPPGMEGTPEGYDNLPTLHVLNLRLSPDLILSMHTSKV